MSVLVLTTHLVYRTICHVTIWYCGTFSGLSGTLHELPTPSLRLQPSPQLQGQVLIGKQHNFYLQHHASLLVMAADPKSWSQCHATAGQHVGRGLAGAAGSLTHPDACSFKPSCPRYTAPLDIHSIIQSIVCSLIHSTFYFRLVSGTYSPD